MAILDQLRDGLHISVSQIRTYLRCGRLFELKYVLGAKPAFKPVPFAFGTSFHAALAKFYVTTKEAGAPPPLQLLTDEFRSAWQREIDGGVPLQADEDEPDDTGHLVDKGVQMLGVFHEHASNGLGGANVEAVEAPFAVSLFDPDTGVEMEEKLVGALDLVLKKGRKHQIVEHKTSSRRYGETEIRYDIQPTGYRIAGKGMGLGDATVTYQILTKAKTPVLQLVDLDRTDEDEEEFQRVAVNVVRGVDAGAFSPVRGWQCRSCPFHHVCRPKRPKLAVGG